jgi:PhzF family phenazine biosynthesis protein
MKTYIVDSFTKEPFKGNPAGVCFPEHDLNEEKMLKIAQEFGLSETAFVQPADKAGTYTIRYFSQKKKFLYVDMLLLLLQKLFLKITDEKELHFITKKNWI